MAKYLHSFETESAFAAAYNGSDYLEPWVSYTDEIEGEEHVDYNRYDPFNGHEYVDLGLPSGTMWAPFNIGASSPEEYGDYYAWGELETKSDYSWETYRFGPDTALTKYNSTDGNMELSMEDDVVRKEMGGEWCLPTVGQFEELMTYTTHESRAVVNGISGTLFTSTFDTGKTLFLPYAGNMDGTGNNNLQRLGTYLTGDLYEGYTSEVIFIDWPAEGEFGPYMPVLRCYGQSARGVCTTHPR